MSFRSTMISCLVFACLVQLDADFGCQSAVAAEDELTVTRSLPKTVPQVQQALKIAKLAAANGMQDLSLRAVREAFSTGHPRSASQVFSPKTFFPQPNTSFRRVGSRMNSLDIDGIAIRQPIKVFHPPLLDLSQLWRTQKFDAKAVYQTLLVVVIPPQQEHQIQLYQETFTSVTDTRQWMSGFNAGHLLVDWALLAGSADSLNQTLEQLKQHRTSQLKATWLQCELSHKNGDTDALRSHLRQLQMYVQQDSTGNEAKLVAQLAFPLLTDPDVAAEAAAVAEVVLDQILAGGSKSVDNHVEPATSILKLIANAYRRANNPARLRETVARLLNANSAYNLRYSSKHSQYVQRLRQAQVATAATIFMDADMFADAAPLVAEYYSLKAKTGRVFGNEYGVQMFRMLKAIPAERRYEIGRTLCLNSSNQVQLQSVFANRLTPPEIFDSEKADASAQNGTSGVGKFTLLGIGPYQDVLTTAQVLADCADELGKLDLLMTELQAAPVESKQSVQNIATMQFFAALKARPIDVAMLNQAMTDRTKEIEGLSLVATELEQRLNSLHDYAVAAKAATVPELRLSTINLLEMLKGQAVRVRNATLNSRVSRLLAHCHALDANVNPEVFQSSQLKHWHSAECDTNQTCAAGAVKSCWVAGDGYVKNLFASSAGLLFFRYPLTGNFKVSATVTDGDALEGGFVYDGILSQPRGRTKSAYTEHIARPSKRSSRVDLTPTELNSNVCELQIIGQRSRFRINRHVAITDDKISGCSPFLALQSRSGQSPGFHSVKITGNPQIPRQVQLLSDHRLRGWSAYHSATTVQQPFGDAEERPYSWKVKNGQLVSERLADSTAAESLLYYHRPLQRKETIAWEFRYRANKQNVHPALGKIAFLMHPDGVKMHWVTDGQLESSGLAPDNLVHDKSAQLTNKLPLKPNDWNKAELTLDAEGVQIRLNGQLVFERSLSNEANQFGFFHNPLTEDAAVRNVSLTGNWPSTFQAAVQEDLMATNNLASRTKERQFVTKLITTEQQNQMGYGIARDAELLNTEQRYARLLKWVLPDETCRDFRLMGGFVTGAFEPASPPSSSTGQTPARKPGDLVSPALDLVNAAAGIGNLLELETAVMTLFGDVSNPNNRVSKLAILSVIATGTQDFEAARRHLQAATKAFSEIPKKPDGSSHADPWPVLVAGWNAIQFAETTDDAVTLLDAFSQHALNAPFVMGQEGEAVRLLRGMAHYRSDIQNGTCKPIPESSEWKPVDAFGNSAMPLAAGSPKWAVTTDGSLKYYGDSRDDFLFYKTPVVGNFSIEMEVADDKSQSPQILYADHWLGLNSGKTHYLHGRRDFGLKAGEITPSALEVEGSYRLRMNVKDGVCSYWVNETMIMEEKLPANPDPWLAVRCSADSKDKTIRRLQLTGSPITPNELDISEQTNLHGWMTTHFKQSMRYAGADWLKSGEKIVGSHRTAHSLSRRESLLQYHRPLQEDGEIEYVFECSPTTIVHPAIGRTVFILDPEGVKEHIVTNGIYGHTGPMPENTSVIPDNQLTTDVKLAYGSNRLKVSVKGDDVLLTLNDETIYRKTLSSTLASGNRRYFGLFHYPGESSVCVQKVVYRGDWTTLAP